MNDPLTRLSQEEKERRILKLDKQFTTREINEIRKMMNKPIEIMVAEPFELEHLNVNWLKEELESASKYIEENEVIHLKTKNSTGVPTVIKYQGRRYILDPDHRRNSEKG